MNEYKHKEICLSKSQVTKLGQLSKTYTRRIPKFYKFLNYKHRVPMFYNIVTKLPKDKKILDFGCNVGWFVFTGLKLGYTIEGVDVEYWGGQYVKRLYETCYALLDIDKHCKIYDGHTLPFENNSFDIVFSKLVLGQVSGVKY